MALFTLGPLLAGTATAGGATAASSGFWATVWGGIKWLAGGKGFWAGLARMAVITGGMMAPPVEATASIAPA